MTYFGGKESSGTYQRIINLIPPHDTYIEPFLGGGAIWRLKKPASLSVVIDLSGSAIKRAKVSKDCEYTDFRCEDGISFLRRWELNGKDTFIYCDPPYLHETRKSNHRYEYELSIEDHINLLNIIKKLPCMVMISGYDSPLYRDQLHGWSHISFKCSTRGGTATEHLWFNYKTPTRLHDYRYLGKDYIDRQRIHRKINRWSDRLKKLPDLERAAIMENLSVDPE